MEAKICQLSIIIRIIISKIKDYNFKDNVNYYRLIQVDFDGVLTVLNTVVVDNTKKDKNTLKTRLNTLGQPVNEEYKGVILEIYDNKVVKRLNY
jgi:hypothetical protein